MTHLSCIYLKKLDKRLVSSNNKRFFEEISIIRDMEFSMISISTALTTIFVLFKMDLLSLNSILNFLAEYFHERTRRVVLPKKRLI